MPAPILVKPIPAQVVNERAAYGPFDLKAFIEPNGSALRFRAETKAGQSLPRGMICTADGLLTGIPVKDTEGVYELIVTIENAEGAVQAPFTLTIKPSLAATEIGNFYLDELKAQVWQALDKQLPLPDLQELYDRPITMNDIYYLLERWTVLKIWDAFNLEPAGVKHALDLAGCSPHYHIYDCGSCLIATPKDLFSHERTLQDALQTSRVMAREVYRRGWTIEFAGLDKMVRAAWIELQHLGNQTGKKIEIVNFKPAVEDVRLYNTQMLLEPLPQSPE
jgi:hypothetical protein